MFLHWEALDILDLVPRATAKFSAALPGNAGTPPGAVSEIQKAASEIEKAATAAASSTPPPAVAPTTPSTDATLKIRDYLLTGTVGLATGVGQLIVVVALIYLLLIAGDTPTNAAASQRRYAFSDPSIAVNRKGGGSFGAASDY